MNYRIDLRVFALAAAATLTGLAHAQVTPRFETVEVAVEATGGIVTLPSGPDSSLVISPCGGCPPKSFPATRSTEYFIGRQQVTLGELSAAVRSQTFLTVRYSVKTGQLTRVTADIAAGRDR